MLEFEKDENAYKTDLVEVKSIRDGGVDVDLSHVDLAEKFAREPAEVPADIKKRIQWKTDLCILPVLTLLYGLQFGDKVAVSPASMLGLRQDLGMVGNMYSWVGSSFYLGYIFAEIPISILVQKLPAAKAMGVICIIWGAVLACSGASQSYAAYISTRVLLGICESVVMPVFITIVSQWYPREVHYSRACVWSSFNGFGIILTNAIGYGLYENKGPSDGAWRFVFIILGSITAATSALFLFHVPDTPHQAWFLTEKEKRWHIEMIRHNKQGYGSHEIKYGQVWEALRDPRLYITFAAVVFNMLGNGISTFQNILLESMGFVKDRSLLLGMSLGGGQLVAMLVVGAISSNFFPQIRSVYVISTGCFTLLGLALLSWGPNYGSQFAGLLLYNMFCMATYNGFVSWVASNTLGHTKKLFSNALLMIAFCVGNIVSPECFLDSQKPSYTTAKTTFAAGAAVAVALEITMLVLNIWENQKRDKEGILEENSNGLEFADLTDYELRSFRYAY